MLLLSCSRLARGFDEGPLLVWWWLRWPRTALRFSDTGVLGRLPAGRSRWIRGTIAMFRGLGLLLLVLALAGPRWPDVHSRIRTEGLAIQMVVDVSGSMAEPDFDWDGKPISRLEAVKRAFHLLVEGGEAPDAVALEGRPDDLIGLVTFATWPETACPVALSHYVVAGPFWSGSTKVSIRPTWCPRWPRFARRPLCRPARARHVGRHSVRRHRG
jgi:Ca-activated chloride channel family protein